MGFRAWARQLRAPKLGRRSMPTLSPIRVGISHVGTAAGVCPAPSRGGGHGTRRLLEPYPAPGPAPAGAPGPGPQYPSAPAGRRASARARQPRQWPASCRPGSHVSGSRVRVCRGRRGSGPTARDYRSESRARTAGPGPKKPSGGLRVASCVTAAVRAVKPRLP